MKKLRKVDLRLLDRVNRSPRSSVNELRQKGETVRGLDSMLWGFRTHGLVDVVVDRFTGNPYRDDRGDVKYKITAAGLQALNPTP